MAILPITIWGEPVLHSPAKPVTEFNDELRTLVADMIDTMHAAPGVGLAAPQVGLAMRLFVYEWEGTKDEPGIKGVAVNPELWLSPAEPESKLELHERAEAEGCLSVPDEAYPLRRAHRALMRAQDEFGTPFELEVSGWAARILQHEFDHLNGIIYVNRLNFVHQRKALKEIAKQGMKGGTWLPEADETD